MAKNFPEFLIKLIFKIKMSNLNSSTARYILVKLQDIGDDIKFNLRENTNACEKH